MIDHFWLQMILSTFSRQRKEEGACEMFPSFLTATTGTQSLHALKSPHCVVDTELLLFYKMRVYKNKCRALLCSVSK